MTNEQLLLKAAQEGDLGTAQKLLASRFLGLAKGANVNARDNSGQTSLILAASHGHLALVELLFTKGAEVNVKSNNGDTALIWAADKGHKEIGDSLLAKGAEVNAKNNDGNTALLIAALRGHKEIGDSLLAKGAEVDVKNNDGNTALMLAAIWGHTEFVESLLAKGADVNLKNKNESTALFCAAGKGHKAVAESLLASGAEVNVKNKNGDTALTVAVLGGHKEIVESLLVRGADVNVKDKDGNTALTVAVSCEHKEMVEGLLAKGAEVDAKNNNGNTALVLAVLGGHKGIAESLLAKGAEVNVKNKNGDTALIVAARQGYKDIVEGLLAKGAEVNVKNNNGDTALIVAAREGHKEIVESLLARGAEVNVKNNIGDTALILAASRGHKKIVESLLAKGADAQSSKQKGALSIEALRSFVFQWSGNDFVGPNKTWVDKVRQENNSAISWFDAQGFVRIPTFAGEEGAAEYCFDMASQAQNSGNTREAWAGFHQALRRFARLQNEKMLGLTCFNLGKVYGVRQEWETARLMFLQSAYLANRTGKEERYAWALFYLGDTSDKLGDKELAIQFMSEALPVFQRVSPNDVPGVQAALNRLGSKKARHEDRRDTIEDIIDQKRLRPLGNKKRLGFDGEVCYDYRAQFSDRPSSERYYEAFLKYAKLNPPPILIEVMVAYTPNTIYSEKYSFILPYFGYGVRKDYEEWAREAIMSCNEVQRQHSYCSGNSYSYVPASISSKGALIRWTIIPPRDLDLDSDEARELLSDPPEMGFDAVNIEGQG